MQLIIKAETTQEAIDAARRHKIARELWNINRVNWTEMALEIEPTEAERLTIVQWFCEPIGEAPYPKGTLLFYSEGN